MDGEEKVRETVGTKVDGEGYSLKRQDQRTFDLAKGEHLVQFSLESRIDPEIFASYDDIFWSKEADAAAASLAEVAVTRIMIVGSTLGGASECKNCPMGAVSEGGKSHCLRCIEGSEANKDRSGCTPCKKGFYNQSRGGKCRRCPPFTSSRRHEEEIPIYAKDGEPLEESAATHCVLDEDLHELQNGLIFKAGHFKARKLCSGENFLNNYNLCAGEKIIGPISDIVNLGEPEQFDELTEQDFGSEDEDLFETEFKDIEEWLEDWDDDDDLFEEDKELSTSLEAEEREWLK